MISAFILPKLTSILQEVNQCKYPIFDRVKIFFSDSTLPWSTYYSKVCKVMYMFLQQSKIFSLFTLFLDLQSLRSSKLKISPDRQVHYEEMLANLKHYPQLNFLDFRFIFVESYGTSYDGKHALSDANILKALFFLDVLFKLPLH